MRRAAAAGCFLLALVACAACGGPPRGQGAGAPPGGFDPNAALPTASVEGVRLSLGARAWLDRGPGAPRSGPLNVTVRVEPQAGATLPEGVTADRMWVIAGDHAWETGLDLLLRLDGRLEGVARGGPDLDPALPADVVLRLLASDGAAHHLRVRLATVPSVD